MSRLLDLIAKAKEAAVINVGGKKAVSYSPKATGVAAVFKMGKTSGGHEINSHSHKGGTHSWGAKDHMDAYKAHFKHVTELSQAGDVHPGLIKHHKEAMHHHWTSASKLEKSLVTDYLIMKSKTKVIGKTRSGKKIHHHHGHKSHENFDHSDHKDAAEVHHKRLMRSMSQLHKVKGHGKKALLKLMDHHHEAVHHHHTKSKKK